ncbi:MAG TPA: hypothetical protein DD473_15880 [Planctomycetaceae bacterium]|nr:hypothetical protein [Planctomycetaceae bacterium]
MVERIAAYYDAASFEKSFSELSAPELLSLDDLRQMNFENIECEVAVNSLDELFNLRSSAHVDWLRGDPFDSELPSSGLWFFVTLDSGHFRPEAVRSSLMFQGTNIEAWSAGLPLSFPEWGLQFDAWWKNWEQHWESSGSDESSEEPTEEDTFIPVGQDPPSDLQIGPPDKPAFAINAEGIDVALLEPIRDYHEGILARNWNRVATAWPNLDMDLISRAQECQTRFLGDEFGRWIYLRQLDDHWQEGPRACVIMRGVEYTAPFEDDAAEAVETVVSYCLRRLDDRWVIRTFSQGWPPYGSAPESPTPKPWLQEWSGIG